MDEQTQMMLQQISTLPPEEQQAALKRLFQDYQGQGAIADEQMQQAAALRDQRGPQGLQAGGQFVASNPLESIMSGVGRFKGGMDYQEALADKKRISEDKTRGVTDVAATMVPQAAQQPMQQPNQEQQMAELLRKLQQGQMAGGSI